MRHVLPYAAAGAGLVLASLAGCAAIEPFERPYTWTTTGANAANLAVMVENPTDLAYGRGTEAADGRMAAAAVDRLRHDRVKALPDSSGATASAVTPAAGAGASLTAN